MSTLAAPSYNVVRYGILIGGVMVDVESYLAACAPLYSRLCRFAYRYTRRRRSAERLVRQALLRLWQDRGGVISGTELDGLLHAAVRREAVAVLGADRAAGRDLDAAFQYAMDELPAKTRGVLRDRLVGGASLSTIADSLANGFPHPRAN